MHVEQVTFKKKKLSLAFASERRKPAWTVKASKKTPAVKEKEIGREKRLLGVEKNNQMFLVNYEL